MEDKIGVFVCTGYGIAEALDIEALCKVVTEECGVPFCKTVDSCEGPGLRSMNEQIENEGLNKVVIAGISARRYKDDAFPADVIVEPFALREHVVWCHPAGEEDTQMVAEDYLRMYIAKIRKMEALEPFQPEEAIDKSILVVGGGITGMTAALEAARTGYEVRLVEKTAKLGGWLARQHRSVPTRPPYRELEDPGVDALIGEIEENPRIQVHTSATTGAIAGAPGLFDVTLKATGNGKPDGEVLGTFRVGAVVQATGWRPTEPRDTLPYGKLDDVIRNVELEHRVHTVRRLRRQAAPFLLLFDLLPHLAQASPVSAGAG
jgi:quinone-modifying oxidoreductase subunit QmoB